MGGNSKSNQRRQTKSASDVGDLGGKPIARFLRLLPRALIGQAPLQLLLMHARNVARAQLPAGTVADVTGVGLGNFQRRADQFLLYLGVGN